MRIPGRARRNGFFRRYNTCSQWAYRVEYRLRYPLSMTSQGLDVLGERVGYNGPRIEQEETVESWISDIEFERLNVATRAVKKILINPLANYLPANWVKTWLRKGGASWRCPTGAIRAGGAAWLSATTGTLKRCGIEFLSVVGRFPWRFGIANDWPVV